MHDTYLLTYLLVKVRAGPGGSPLPPPASTAALPAEI